MKQSFLKSPRDWLAIGAAFVVGFFVSGMARLSGLLFVASLERYHVGREKASVPFILSFTIRNLSSPITGYLGTKFDPRSIVLVGCFFAVTGAGVGFFAEDFMVIIISWGGIYGLGYGLGCALVPKILSEHFPHNFDKATGLYLCSISIAGVILPVLGDYSIKTYGVSGSFLILSSAVMHTIPAAMILSIVTTNVRTSMKEQVQNAVSYRIPKRRTKITEGKFLSTNVPLGKCEISLEKPSSPKQNEDIGHPVCCRIPERSRSKASVDEFVSIRDSSDKHSPHLDSSKKHEEFEIYALFPEKQVHEPYIDSNTQIEKNEISLSTLNEGRNWALQSFSLFLDPTYILILLTQGVTSYVSVTTLTVVVDAARDHGVEEYNELHVLEALNFFDFLGRILLGHITDSGYISKTNFSSLCFACLGVILPVFACLEGFAYVLVAVSMYGLLTGFLVVGGLGIVQQYIEKKNSSMGFAAVYSVYGLMSFSQSPLIGFFRENLQSYDGLFYLMGAMCFSSSILNFLIPKAASHRDQKKLTVETY